MKLQSFALFSLIIIIICAGIFSPVNAQDEPKAVLFAGSSGGGDAVLIEHLQGLGLEIVVQDAEEVTPEGAEQYSMVYISESISSGDIADRLNHITTPIISSEHYLSDDMGIAGDVTDEDYGQTDRKYQLLTLADGQHPLAAGLSGDVQVYKKNGKYSFTKPGGDVQIIATFPEDPAKVLVYAYEKGAKNLNGDTIPARRVFFFLFAAQESKLTEDGWKMFDAAVNWCLEVGKPTTLAAAASEAAPEEDMGDVVPATTGAIPQDGLVAYWNFDENSGTTVADSSGLGHDGTFVNMDAAWTTGVAGYGLGFDGKDDQILIAHQDDIDFADEDFSISFWVLQFNHENSGRYIVKGSWKAPKSGKRYEVFHHSSGMVRFSIDDNSVKSRVELPDDEFVTGEWVHVVAVRDTADDELRVYANGELKGSAADETGDISQDEEMFIGGTVDENSFFDGFMDEVAIYNRVLSEDEILALYNSAPEEKIIPKKAEGRTAAIERTTGTPPEPFAGTPAFPGAEGWGMGSQGGRGGTVYKVTNLNDSGPGSLRAAVDATGPRIVMFDVSGTIELQSEIRIGEDFITIAGQTAPGDGIALKNFPITVAANHVIIRYLRVRLGDESKQETDAIWVSQGSNIILDHCSTSWSVDETLSVSQRYDPSLKFLDNVTVQWSIISESLNRSVHAKGEHGYGSLVRGHDGAKYTFHHNLWAHHRSRMPRPGNYEPADKDTLGPLMDFRNNVFYNWKGLYGGYNADADSLSQYNFINNYYVPGPDSDDEDSYAFDESCLLAKAYFAGNYMNHEEPADPWKLVSGGSDDSYKLAEPVPAGTISTEPAPDAYQRVLESAGASKVRDSVDQRVVEDVKNKTGKIIDSPNDVGGWPELKSEAAPVDSDGDGMPDEWEVAQGLNKDDAADGNQDQDGDGYTNLEEYLNSLIQAL